jgi:hypothetical protein
VAKGIPVAVFLCAVLAIPSAAAADGAASWTGPSASTVTSLASEVERLVQLSKPADWDLRRACLYYAFAGQHLLWQRGIAASIWIGAVIYDPGTPTSHKIWPHAWLETATHYIDYSALPRWGQVKIIPLHLVARSPLEVRPGITRVLALRRMEDLDVAVYLATHRARFDRIVMGDE